MSHTSASSPSKRMSGEEETPGGRGQHGQEDLSHRKGSIRSRSSSSHRERSRRAREHSLDSADSSSVGESAFHFTG